MTDPEERLGRALEVIDDVGGTVNFGDGSIVISSLDGDAEVHLIPARDDPEAHVDPGGTGHQTVSLVKVYLGDEEYEVEGTRAVEMGGLGPLLEGE